MILIANFPSERRSPQIRDPFVHWKRSIEKNYQRVRDDSEINRQFDVKFFISLKFANKFC